MNKNNPSESEGLSQPGDVFTIRLINLIAYGCATVLASVPLYYHAKHNGASIMAIKYHYDMEY